MTSSSDTPLQDLQTEFAGHLRRVRLRSPRTVEKYVRIIHNLDVRVGGEAALIGVDTPTLKAFLGSGTDSHIGIARARWNVRLSAVRAFCAFLQDTGRRTDNPAQPIARQRVPYTEPDALNLSEMVALVEAAERHSPPIYRTRNVAILNVFFHCALRVSEVANLDVRQADLAARVFRSVRRKGSRTFGAVFNDVVAESLEAYLANRHRLHGADNEQALWLSDRGTRLSVRMIQAFVSRYAVLAGIERRVSPHALRHSSATQLSTLGVPIRVIQEICGHASVATTERYIHVAGVERISATEKLGQAFAAERQSRAQATGPPG